MLAKLWVSVYVLVLVKSQVVEWATRWGPMSVPS